jgi:hypothetical protein
MRPAEAIWQKIVLRESNRLQKCLARPLQVIFVETP